MSADSRGGTRSLEIESTFDVEAATPLPDFSGLPGVAAVSGPERRDLDARYFDVASFDDAELISRAQAAAHTLGL